MAFNVNPLPAGFASAALGDSPYFLAANVIDNTPRTIKWTFDGDDGSADQTDTTFLTTRLIDRFQNLITKPISDAGKIYFLNFNLSASTSRKIDALAILNHNLGDMGGANVLVRIEVDNSATFPAPTLVKTFIVPTGDNKRIALKNFGAGNEQFDNVQFLRMKFSASSGDFGTNVPQIGEFIIGERRQMSTKANHPFNDAPFGFEGKESRVESGFTTTYVHNEGGSVLRRHWQLKDAADSLHSIVDTDQLRAWYRDCGRGSKAFLYVEDPQTDQSGSARWCKVQRNTQLDLSLTGFAERNQTFEFIEQAPFVDVEVNG